MKRIAPKGIYEYVIARTKYIDEIFTKAIEEKYTQILIFGAGFDSRGIRLLSPESNVTLFELESQHTQNAKINQLKKRKISVPKKVIFIPIDFNKESIEEKLDQAGFQRGKKSLFILEGLIMYLDDAAVESTFELIKNYAGSDSLLVFDTIYASVLREEHLYYGEEEIYATVKNAEEKWTFGIERKDIQSFLQKRGFQLLEQLNSQSLEQKYFTNEKCELIGKINCTHTILLSKLSKYCCRVSLGDTIENL